MTEKAALRDQARARREAEADREAKSRTILDQVAALDVYVESVVVSSYVGVPPEVLTLPLLTTALELGKTVVLPWVHGDDLRLTRIETLDELVTTPFGLLEPSALLREHPDRLVPAEVCDTFLVPGVAFDREGYRLGRGRGYYDRLLSRASTSAIRIGLAFECQIVERIPREDHDQRMDLIVTEVGQYRTE